MASVIVVLSSYSGRALFPVAGCPPFPSRTKLVLGRNVKMPHLRAACSSKSGRDYPIQDEAEDAAVGDLKLPEEWTSPATAAQEAEWLRTSLHRWLDDEYCPEEANVEISKRCAAVYHRCLMEKELDVSNILLQMIGNLETFSFKESFHGAFSSANAAIDLIIKRASESG